MNAERSPDRERLARVLARLDGLTNWEKARRSAERMRLSIEPERDLLERLGSPHERLRIVHVTGTKGKGSTAALIAAGLARGGLRAALYTSPHIERIEERLAIDGEPVSADQLAEGLERALDARSTAVAERTAGADATWFDVLTGACLWIAGQSGAPWLVAEVGLGGRLDSTNVLDGEVCVITCVELEHQSVLGTTREAIAREKAGILKPGSTAITLVGADDPAGRVIDERARELGLEVLRPRPSSPDVSERNLSLARATLEALGSRGVRCADGRPLSGALLDADAARAAALPGRMEVFDHGGVPVVIDGGHVAESVRDVLAELRRRPGLGGKAVAVVGMARDKDRVRILKALAPHVDRFVCSSVGSELHFTPEEIAGEAQRIGMAPETVAEPRKALERALELSRRAGADSWVLVIGSLYLAGAVRPALVCPSSVRRC